MDHKIKSDLSQGWWYMPLATAGDSEFQKQELHSENLP